MTSLHIQVHPTKMSLLVLDHIQ